MTSFRLVAILALLCSALTSQAVPIYYQFIQTGYPGGAYVSGSFSVDDLNGNGIIDFGPFAGVELRGGSVSFSGNDAIPAFGVSFAYRFSMNLTTGGLSFEGVSGDPVRRESITIGQVYARINGQDVYQTPTGPFVLTRVPDSGHSLCLMGLSFCGFIALRRKFTATA